MKDTPETNEAQLGTGRVSVDFARRLERERDEAREIAAWWRDNWKKGRTMSMIASTELPWENSKDHPRPSVGCIASSQKQDKP